MPKPPKSSGVLGRKLRGAAYPARKRLSSAMPCPAFLRRAAARRRSSTIKALAATGLIAGVFGAAPTPAQIEEVVVTATKRGAVDVQDVAVSISTVDGDFLDASGAEGVLGFTRKVGIQTDDEGPGEKRFIIRGLNAAGSATVGLYYDDIPTTGFGQGGNGNGQPDFRILDLERVEILRGPQGTLYGAGSIGGTIRYVSKKPNLQEFEGSFGIDYGDIGQGGGDRYALEGMLDIPLIENRLGLRMVGFYADSKGIVDNGFLQIKGVDSRESDGGRAILEWLPTDALTVTASYWRQDSEVGDRTQYNLSCNPTINSCYLDPAHGGVAPDTAAPVRSTKGKHLSTQGITTPFSEDMDIYSLRLQYETDFGTFTSSSSWFIRDALTAFDSSDFAAPLFMDPGSVLPVSTDQDTEQFSQELLFSSDFDGPVNFVAGFFYQDRSSTFRQRAVLSLPTPGKNGRELLNDPEPSFVVANFFPPPINNGVIFDDQIERDFTNTAFFGEVNWQATERLALDLGIRWFELKNELLETKLQNPDFTILFLGLPDEGGVAGKSSFSDTIFKATASYDLVEGVKAYVTFGEGFREGGVNPLRTAVNLPQQFDSDTVTNYEAGLKTELLDGLLVVNTAYFFIEWENLQTFVPDPTGLFDLFLNLEDGGADVQGFELEATYLPNAITGLQLQFGLQWTDTELTADIPGLDAMGNLVPGDPLTTGVVGDPLAQVADWTLSGNAQYNFPAFGGEAFVLVDWSYTGESNSSSSPRSPYGAKLGDFHLVNLRLGLSGEAWGGWSATIYANNLFDEDGWFFYEDRAGDFDPELGALTNGPTVITTYPRTVGLSLRKDF